MKKIALFSLTAAVLAILILIPLPVHAGEHGYAFPTGTYTTTITLADVQKYGLPSPYPEILVGDWEMVFHEDGTFEISNLTTGQSGQDTYMANPVVVIFGGKSTGELACLPPGSAAYKWSAYADTLVLKGASEMNDRCWGRYIVSTSHPLVKVP